MDKGIGVDSTKIKLKHKSSKEKDEKDEKDKIDKIDKKLKLKSKNSNKTLVKKKYGSFNKFMIFKGSYRSK